MFSVHRYSFNLKETTRSSSSNRKRIGFELLTHNPPPPSQTIFVSFDVLGLFPHVPLQPTVARVDKLLADASVPPSIISEFKSLLALCLAPNICKFNDSVYRLPNDIGISIKSPLGSLIAEVFMSRLENEVWSFSITTPPSSPMCFCGVDMLMTYSAYGMVLLNLYEGTVTVFFSSFFLMILARMISALSKKV